MLRGGARGRLSAGKGLRPGAGTGSPPPSSPSFLRSLSSLDRRGKEAGAGRGAVLRRRQTLRGAVSEGGRGGGGCGQPQALRSRSRDPAPPGLTSFLSLCFSKLLPAASGFPEGSSRAEAGEGSGRGVEESCCSHPGPRLGLHGKVSAAGCSPSACEPEVPQPFSPHRPGDISCFLFLNPRALPPRRSCRIPVPAACPNATFPSLWALLPHLHVGPLLFLMLSALVPALPANCFIPTRSSPFAHSLPACSPCDLPLLLVSFSALGFGQLCTSDLLLPLASAPDRGGLGEPTVVDSLSSAPEAGQQLTPQWLWHARLIPARCTSESLPLHLSVRAEGRWDPGLHGSCRSCSIEPQVAHSALGNACEELYPTLPTWGLLFIYLFPFRTSSFVFLLFVYEIVSFLCQGLCSVLLCA